MISPKRYVFGGEGSSSRDRVLLLMEEKYTIGVHSIQYDCADFERNALDYPAEREKEQWVDWTFICILIPARRYRSADAS